MLSGIIPGYEHEAESHEDAGNNAAHEHLADVVACGIGEDDHHNARRNDGAERTGRGNNRNGKAFFVAVIDKRGDHKRTDSRGVRVAGAGNAGHYYACHGCRVRNAAADVADDALCESNEFFCYTGLLHDLACHHEKRNGHVCEAVGRTVYLACEYDIGKRRVSQQPCNAGSREAHRDRSADKKHDKKQ